MVFWMILSTALFTGFMGSLHCVGMCGPIAMALPLGRQTFGGRMLGILLYNVGRVFTYSIIGAVLGTVGKGFSLFGWQQAVSIVAGVAVLVYLLPTGRSYFSFINQPFGFVKKYFQPLFSQPGMANLFLIGLLNGLLPCGLVYLALAGALAIGDTLYSALSMAAFGFGTVPLMLSLTHISGQITSSHRAAINKFSPYFVAFMGLLFIVRGLNLGIPYLSPKETTIEIGKPAETQWCHK